MRQQFISLALSALLVALCVPATIPQSVLYRADKVIK